MLAVAAIDLQTPGAGTRRDPRPRMSPPLSESLLSPYGGDGGGPTCDLGRGPRMALSLGSAAAF
jgi:hypothetical protein